MNKETLEKLNKLNDEIDEIKSKIREIGLAQKSCKKRCIIRFNHPVINTQVEHEMMLWDDEIQMLLHKERTSLFGKLNDLQEQFAEASEIKTDVNIHKLLVDFANYCNSFNIENNCISGDDIDDFIKKHLNKEQP